MQSCRTATPATHTRPVALLAAVPGTGKARRAGSVTRLPIVERHDSAIAAVADRVSLEGHVPAKRAQDMGSAAVLLPLIALLLAWRPVLLG